MLLDVVGVGALGTPREDVGAGLVSASVLDALISGEFVGVGTTEDVNAPVVDPDVAEAGGHGGGMPEEEGAEDGIVVGAVVVPIAAAVGLGLVGGATTSVVDVDVVKEVAVVVVSDGSPLVVTTVVVVTKASIGHISCSSNTRGGGQVSWAAPNRDGLR